MNALAETRPVPAAGELAGLEPLTSIRRRWPMLIGGVLTALMVIGLGRQLFGYGLAGL